MSETLLADEKKTAFNPDQPGRFSGDFNITKMKLTSANFDVTSGPGANFIDLTTSIWHELNIYEDIYSPVISGDITLTDTVGLIESFPIIGEEILDLSFSTAGAALSSIEPSGGPQQIAPAAPEPIDAPKQISNRFRVYKVDPPVQVTDTSRTIKLYFVTDTQFTNLLSKVRKTYPAKENEDGTLRAYNDRTYTHADAARDIFYDFLINKNGKKPQKAPPAKKPFLVEPTRYKTELVVPDWNPFKAISFLASKSVSANQKTKGANFVFYQTLQGFRFVSIETLMLGGFRLFQLKDVDTDKEYGHLKENIDLNKAKENESSYIPIFDDNIVDNPDLKPFVASYKFVPANMGESKNSSFDSVTSYRLTSSFDTMKNVALGMYSNRVITHDLIRMRVDRRDFQYVKEPDQIITVDPSGSRTSEQNKDKGDPRTRIIDEAVKTEIGRLCSDNADFLGRPESHISLVPTNFGQGFKLQDGPVKGGIEGGQKMKTENDKPIKLDIKENHVEDVLARRISQKLQLDSVKLTFSAPGDSAREVGDLISFDYPSENPEIATTSGQGAGHKYYSGKFLITALRHKITQNEYTMHVEAIKDGYKSKISPTFRRQDPLVQITDAETGLPLNEEQRASSTLAQNLDAGVS